MPALPDTITDETAERLSSVIERHYPGHFRTIPTLPNDELQVRESGNYNFHYIFHTPPGGSQTLVFDTLGDSPNTRQYCCPRWLISLAIALNHERQNACPTSNN